ncbi:amidohydrolase family protein [Tistrella mobilis]|uniref:amidohydrolase family protein n=1 Tax=Tistrella mobilis TaxID=171437 RepID=UPI003557B3DA
MRRYTVISADGHLETPAEAWFARIPAAYRPFAPRLLQLPDGGEAWLIEGSPLIHNGTNISGGGRLQLTGASYLDDRGRPKPGTGGPVQRLHEQDADGIDAEVLFPPAFLARFIEGIGDQRAYRAIIRAYNISLAEDYCSMAPDRLIGVGLIPVGPVEYAIAELENCRSLGLKAVCLSQFPAGGPRPSPADDAFWRRAIDLAMPLTVHVAVGDRHHPMLVSSAAGRFDPATVLMRGCVPAILPFLCATIADGLFDRFPDLVFYVAESNAGWLPEVLFMMDDNHAVFGEAMSFPISAPPSHYVRRHFRFSFFKDPVIARLLEPADIDAGRWLPTPDMLMWCSDFPHSVTTFPYSRRWLTDMLGTLPETIRRQILVDTPCRFFGLDPAARLTPTPVIS